jgi:hypothetical protein
MSIHAVARALFDIASTSQRTAEFKADPQGFLAGYPLEPDEVQMIVELDVREMLRRQLNPMLAMRAFSAIEGRARMPEYLRRLKES